MPRKKVATAIAKPPGPKPSIDLARLVELRYKHKLSFPAIAKQVGITHQAVQARLAKFEAMIGDPEHIENFKQHETIIQDAIRTRYSSHLLQADLEKCSPRDAAIIYGTLYDKHRLSTGQSTANIASLFAKAMDDE